MIYHPTRLKRRGAVWPLLLGCLALLLAGVALAVDGALLWQARQELQVAADSSALGAALELTDDQLLRKQTGAMVAAVQRAQDIAEKLAHQHHVLGRSLKLEPQDDIVLGFFDASSKVMQPASPNDWDSPLLNAVEVTSHRTRERGTPVGLFFTRLFQLDSANVAASSTAFLDRQVIGFRPTQSLNVPLMPIALFSDPTGLDELTWEYQVDKPLSLGGGGMDAFSFNKLTRRWLHADEGGQGDGLPEFVLKIPLGSVIDETNGALLRLGKQDSRTLPRQMLQGLGVDDLEAQQGQLQLSWDGLLPIEEAAIPGSNSLAQIIEVLETLSKNGDARLWPLYLPGPATTDASGLALLRGFVAARVCAVEKNDKYLEVILQPTILTTGTALTSANAAMNPYIGKIRLVR
jgi:hypothetical protein